MATTTSNPPPCSQTSRSRSPKSSGNRMDHDAAALVAFGITQARPSDGGGSLAAFLGNKPSCRSDDKRGSLDGGSVAKSELSSSRHHRKNISQRRSRSPCSKSPRRKDSLAVRGRSHSPHTGTAEDELASGGSSHSPRMGTLEGSAHSPRSSRRGGAYHTPRTHHSASGGSANPTTHRFSRKSDTLTAGNSSHSVSSTLDSLDDSSDDSCHSFGGEEAVKQQRPNVGRSKSEHHRSISPRRDHQEEKRQSAVVGRSCRSKSEHNRSISPCRDHQEEKRQSAVGRRGRSKSEHNGSIFPCHDHLEEKSQTAVGRASLADARNRARSPTRAPSVLIPTRKTVRTSAVSVANALLSASTHSKEPTKVANYQETTHSQVSCQNKATEAGTAPSVNRHADSKETYPSGGTTLLDKVGGPEALKGLVLSFYERICKDEVLQPFFKGVNLKMLRDHQFHFMRIIFSGEAPRGWNAAKIITERHAILFDKGVNEHHFDLVGRHWKEAMLSSDKIAKSDIDEVMAAIAPLRGIFAEMARTVTGRNAFMLSRLGGAANHKRLLYEMYTRMTADPELTPLLRGVPMAKLQSHQQKFVDIALAGMPTDFDLTAFLKDKHQRLLRNGLTGRHFDRMVESFVLAMREVGVNNRDIEEAKATILPLRDLFHQNEDNAGTSAPQSTQKCELQDIEVLPGATGAQEGKSSPQASQSEKSDHEPSEERGGDISPERSPEQEAIEQQRQHAEELEAKYKALAEELSAAKRQLANMQHAIEKERCPVDGDLQQRKREESWTGVPQIGSACTKQQLLAARADTDAKDSKKDPGRVKVHNKDPKKEEDQVEQKMGAQSLRCLSVLSKELVETTNESKEKYYASLASGLAFLQKSKNTESKSTPSPFDEVASSRVSSGIAQRIARSVEEIRTTARSPTRNQSQSSPHISVC